MALPNAKILIHQVSGGFQGRRPTSRSTPARRSRSSGKLDEIMAQHTGQPLEKVSKDIERDYFMSSGEAKEYGIIDEVIEHR